MTTMTVDNALAWRDLFFCVLLGLGGAMLYTLIWWMVRNGGREDRRRRHLENLRADAMRGSRRVG